MQGEEVSIEELASNLATYKDQLHQVVFILFIYFFSSFHALGFFNF